MQRLSIAGAFVALFALTTGSVHGQGEAGNVETRLSAVEAALAKVPAADPWALVATWNNGIVFKSNNGQASLKIGGRGQLDAAWFAEDGDNEAMFGDQADGVEFRRARLYMSGKVHKNFEYKAQYDFAGSNTTNRPGFKDVYGGLTGLDCIGGVRVGHFKEPFGLEELTSSNYITFMERSLTSVFTPARNVGVMAHNTFGEHPTGTWAIGVFRNTNNQTAFGSGDGDYSVTGRGNYLPIYEKKGEQVLHLGIAGSFQGAPNNSARYRQRPSAHLATRFVDTGTIRVNNDQRLGGEAAYVCGPFSLQGEAMAMFANGVQGQNDFCSFGAYIMASYFFTGEVRPYDTKKGVFKRVKPNNNFLGGDGSGAWEGAVRYSFLDLDTGQDLSTANTELHDVTAGVNWYWNPVFRVMFNYVWSHPSAYGNLHVGEIRFQFNF